MQRDNTLEKAVFDVDWSEISENERSKLLNEYSDYVNSLRMAMVSISGFSTNLRSLFVLMVLSLVMTLTHADNKKIVISLLAVQFAKTLFSRLVEKKTVEAAEESQEKFYRVLEKLAKLRR